ncbi:hypothetical protein B9Z55_024311 [Caenorhabditis nigoni]|nr:hypothetical protein B9Z55_024311 [Caenorhabditis nigoni]
MLQYGGSSSTALLDALVRQIWKRDQSICKSSKKIQKLRAFGSFFRKMIIIVFWISSADSKFRSLYSIRFRMKTTRSPTRSKLIRKASQRI